MASTVPAKSQPLHNFTLPHLKWNKDGHSSGHHHRRRSVKSPSRRPNPSSASPVRQSPLCDSVAATPPRYHSPLRDSAAAAAASPVHGNYLGKQAITAAESSKSDGVRDVAKQHSPDNTTWHLPSRDVVSESEDSARSKSGLLDHRRSNPKNLTLDTARNGVCSTNSERAAQKFDTKSKAKDADAAGVKRSKILIKIPCKTTKPEEENPPEEPPKVGGNNDEDDESDELQEEGKINTHSVDEETKTWNLRPRKPIRKSLNVNGSIMKNNGSSVPEKNKIHSPLRIMHKRSVENNSGAAGEKEKRKLSISVALTKEEIEEDIFSLTGSKPARRPKKRAKSIQKQVDCVFPGSWLVGITADSYKVSENSLKI